MLKFTATSIHLTAKCRRGCDIRMALFRQFWQQQQREVGKDNLKRVQEPNFMEINRIEISMYTFFSFLEHYPTADLC